MQKDDVLLRMEGICKSFPGVKALDDAQLTVRPGTVHALMGENGAGKSTLMKCLFGIYSKDAGTIWFDGKEVNFKSSRDALDNGVAMVHQELNQALKRSVMDNIWLGRYPRIKLGGAKMPFVSDKAEYDMTMEVFKDLNFEKFGININPRTIMSTMPVSRRQMVEIAKAVSFNSKIIVLDEPTSSLTEAEVEVLFSIINMLKARGVGIVYISHKMKEIWRIADDVTVMRDGRWITTRHKTEYGTDDDSFRAEVIRNMCGRELSAAYPPKDNIVHDDPMIVVEGLTAVPSCWKPFSAIAPVKAAPSRSSTSASAPRRAVRLKTTAWKYTTSMARRWARKFPTCHPTAPSSRALRWSPRNAAQLAFSASLTSAQTPSSPT